MTKELWGRITWQAFGKNKGLPSTRSGWVTWASMLWRLEANGRPARGVLGVRGTREKRVNRLMQWRQDCVAKDVRDGNGHHVTREQGGLKCKDCGRFGRNLKQVKCGSAHRGKIAKAPPTGIKDFWSKFPSKGENATDCLRRQRGRGGIRRKPFPKRRLLLVGWGTLPPVGRIG